MAGAPRPRHRAGEIAAEREGHSDVVLIGRLQRQCESGMTSCSFRRFAALCGWRTAVRDVRIQPQTQTEVVIDERWRDLQRWRAFGHPIPSVDGAGSLLINGDHSFFSGVYLADLDASTGLAVDVALSMPITADKWQVIHALIAEVEKPRALATWNSRSGYIADFVGDALCAFSFPHGEGTDAVERPPWLPALRHAARNPDLRLGDGRWHAVRLQILPDSRCGLAIDGHPVVIGPVGVARRSLALILQGSAFGTRIRVGRVLIRKGVATDMDWSQLQFIGDRWTIPRSVPAR